MLTIVLAWPAAMCPGEAADRDRQAASASSPSPRVPDAGFWPTPRMIELVLMKGVGAIATRYELDDVQRTALEKDFLTRYPAALKRHRAVLQPMINEILEMQLAGETPTAERVADMARRFEPVLKDARNVLRGTRDTLKPLLGPDQRLRWDRDFLKVWAGFAAADAQVARWQQGQFKSTDWPFRRAAGASASQPGSASGSAQGLELLNPLRALRRRSDSGGRGSARYVPLDQWQAYVKRFIRRHRLNKGQANQAMAILKDVRQRAQDYNKQNRDLFKRIERERAGADPARREKLNRDLEQLRQPLRVLFDELRTRLDDVLRSEQR